MERPVPTAVTELFSWLKNETAATDSGLMRAVMARSKTLNSSFNSWNAAMGTHTVKTPLSIFPSRNNSLFFRSFSATVSAIFSPDLSQRLSYLVLLPGPAGS